MIATRPVPFLLSLPDPGVGRRAAAPRRHSPSRWVAEPRWIVLETFRPPAGCAQPEDCAGCPHASQCGTPRPAA